MITMVPPPQRMQEERVDGVRDRGALICRRTGIDRRLLHRKVHGMAVEGDPTIIAETARCLCTVAEVVLRQCIQVHGMIKVQVTAQVQGMIGLTTVHRTHKEQTIGVLTEYRTWCRA
mmetsp:Transcript_14037/g.21849  ORF Transcript_14037/g.21849 Transcript_14037/m.21849 type:complete len:117 (+) Transcript_14037:623-973(+)